MQYLSGVFGLLDQISNVLDIPSKFLGILGLVSTVGGYLTGRRASRSQSPEAVVAATLAQLGYAAPGAASVPGDPVHPGAGASAPPAQPRPVGTPQPGVLLAGPAPLAAAAAVPTFGAAYAAGGLVQPLGVQRKTLWQRVSYPWLAVASIVSLVFSVSSYVFLVASSGDQNETALTMLGLFVVLTWGVGLATIIWGTVHALRFRRWGWLTSVVLIGLAGMVFLAPSVITLLFALVGPKTPRVPKGAALPIGAYVYPQPGGPRAAPAQWMPPQWPPQPPRLPQPMPIQAGAQQPTSYPGWQQPPATNPPMPQRPAAPQQPWTYPPGYAPSSSQPSSYPPAMMPQQPAPQQNPVMPMSQADPAGPVAPADPGRGSPPPGAPSQQPPPGAPGPDHP